jgi:hypothetical protein
MFDRGAAFLILIVAGGTAFPAQAHPDFLSQAGMLSYLISAIAAVLIFSGIFFAARRLGKLNPENN